MTKQKEEADKGLLKMEIVMGVATIIFYLILVMIASLAEMHDSVRFLIIITSTIFVLIMCFMGYAHWENKIYEMSRM